MTLRVHGKYFMLQERNGGGWQVLHAGDVLLEFQARAGETAARTARRLILERVRIR